MIKRKDYKYLDNPDYSLAGERFFKNATDFLSSNSVVNAAYLSSNEQLDKYIPIIGVEGKKLATVGSSGDQILNALFYGCKDITLIDANVLAEPYIEYKIALIKTYSYEEFKYLMFEDRSIFDFRVYQKISKHLKGAVRQFFDEIMLMEEDVEFDGTIQYYDAFSDLKILTGIVNNLPHTEFSEFYHSEEAYKKLQKILIDGEYKLSYIVSRLEEFPKRLPEKYDVILLSNIYDYVLRFKFNNVLRKLYDEKLNEGGTIQFQYFFDDSPFKKRPKKFINENVDIINLHAKPASTPEEKDRDECKVYTLKKPNSKQLELG